MRILLFTYTLLATMMIASSSSYAATHPNWIQREINGFGTTEQDPGFDHKVWLAGYGIDENGNVFKANAGANFGAWRTKVIELEMCNPFNTGELFQVPVNTAITGDESPELRILLLKLDFPDGDGIYTQTDYEWFIGHCSGSTGFNRAAPTDVKKRGK